MGLRRAAYQEAILRAAEQEFARLGFVDTKMTAIAHAAGLSLATLYKSFPGKVEIWNGLHAQRMADLRTAVDDVVAPADSPLDGLLAGIAAVARFLTQHPDYLRLSLGASSGWLTVAGRTEVQNTVWNDGLRTIDAGVRAARLAGQISDLRPRIAAGLIVSALQVWLADWLDATGVVSEGGDQARESEAVVGELMTHLSFVLGGDQARSTAR